MIPKSRPSADSSDKTRQQTVMQTSSLRFDGCGLQYRETSAKTTIERQTTEPIVQFLSSFQTGGPMKSHFVHSSARAVLICVILGASLWAQSPGGSPGSGATPASGQQAVDKVAPTMTGSGTPAALQTTHMGSASDPSFIIGNTDVLAINVWKEPDVSRTIPVRSDGRISLPLAGELQAAGRTPLELEADIANKLRAYITDPQVTVIVQEINSQKFNILGQVARPGSYPLTHLTTVLDAIALAGGFRDFAKTKSIYILRQDSAGHEVRIPFNYKVVIKGKNPEQNIRINPYDTIVVP